MKIYKVESKYKNPDKFIEKLKQEIDYKLGRIGSLEHEKERLLKEKEQLRTQAYGAEWFEYSKEGASISVNLNSSYETVRSGQVKYGTRIIAFGIVDEIKITKNQTSAGMKIQKVHVRI